MVRNLKSVGSWEVVPANTSPNPPLTKGASRCQVFPPVRLNCRIASVMVTLCLIGPLSASGFDRLVRIRDHPVEAPVAHPERHGDGAVSEKIIAQPEGHPVVRHHLNLASRAVEISHARADELAVAQGPVGGRPGIVPDLGRGGGGEADEGERG